jgi:hypothetical protein
MSEFDTPSSPPSNNVLNSADVALHLSSRLSAGAKVKSVVNIEAGLEMIALALTISSEVCVVKMFGPI